jgi:hypothetical protein
MLKGLKLGAPRWLVEALDDEWRDGMDHDLLKHRKAGFDHVRTYRNRIALSQAYEATGASLAETVMKLMTHDVNVHLWGVSPYYPSRTFSMVLWRDEDEALARELMEKMLGPFARSEQPKAGQEW